MLGAVRNAEGGRKRKKRPKGVFVTERDLIIHRVSRHKLAGPCHGFFLKLARRAAFLTAAKRGPGTHHHVQH